MDKIEKRSNFIAIILSLILLMLIIICLVLILLPDKQASGYIADIYQYGELYTSISLSEIQESYSFTVTSASGGENKIQVYSDSIGIVSANCPDKLCVHQGLIHDSKLPITCLPNGLVIQLRPVNSTAFNSITPDINTY